MNWHVVRIRPEYRLEFAVMHALTQREHMAMVPFEEKLVQHPRTKRLEARKYPFFPCYVMAAFEDLRDFAKAKAAINGQMEAKGQKPAIMNLIGPNGRPWALSEEDVAFMRSLSIEKPTEVNLHKALKIGEDIRFLDGPYQGHTGKLGHVDRKRIRAKLMMFGQMRDVEVPVTTTVVAA